MKILALIPARGGSKGLIRKNLRDLAGKPLIAYPIITAKQSKLINRIIVSTDNEEIANVAKDLGAEVPFIRPQEYATDTSLDLVVFEHCLKWLGENEGELPDLIVQLRATAPIRDASVIDQAIKVMIDHPQASSLRSVSSPSFTPYKMWVIKEGYLDPILQLEDLKDWYDMPRQQLPQVYAQDGLVDIVRPSTVLEHKSMAGNRIIAFTHDEEVVDIDDLASLQLANKLVRENYRDLTNRIKLNTIELGMIQGRLTESKNGQLQEFPQGEWQNEFIKAKENGFEYIELIADKEKNLENPLWSTNGLIQLKALQNQTGIKVPVICVDSIINNNFSSEYLIVIDIITKGAILGVKKIVLPFFGASDLSMNSFVEIQNPLQKCAEVASEFGIELCLETSLNASDLKKLILDLDSPHIKICYDIGNTTYFGHDIVKDIYFLGDLITHLHIKDRTLSGENVILGTGASNIRGALNALMKIGYQGTFTFENTRGDDPIKTANFHRRYIMDLLHELYEEKKPEMVLHS